MRNIILWNFSRISVRNVNNTMHICMYPSRKLNSLLTWESANPELVRTARAFARTEVQVRVLRMCLTARITQFVCTNSECGFVSLLEEFSTRVLINGVNWKGKQLNAKNLAIHWNVTRLMTNGLCDDISANGTSALSSSPLGKYSINFTASFHHHQFHCIFPYKMSQLESLEFCDYRIFQNHIHKAVFRFFFDLEKTWSLNWECVRWESCWTNCNHLNVASPYLKLICLLFFTYKTPPKWKNGAPNRKMQYYSIFSIIISDQTIYHPNSRCQRLANRQATNDTPFHTIIQFMQFKLTVNRYLCCVPHGLALFTERTYSYMVISNSVCRQAI